MLGKPQYPPRSHGLVGPKPVDAFTLTELLVTISVIAVLAALIVPAIGRAGFRSKVANCTSNMRQLGVACANYSTEGRHVLPSFQLQTASSMSNYHEINPTMVAIETVSSLERFGMTSAKMWYCPTGKRFDIAQTTYKSVTGRMIGSTADLVEYFKIINPVAGLGMFWWIPRELEGSGGKMFPDPKISRCRIPDGWPARPDDANASVQPIASDWLVGSIDEKTSGISGSGSGGHVYGGTVLENGGRIGGTLVNNNCVFVDGHVETRPRAAIKWQMKSMTTDTVYFY